MGTVIQLCMSCEKPNPLQDRLYGKNMRVMNTGKTDVTCTVCGKSMVLRRQSAAEPEAAGAAGGKKKKRAKTAAGAKDGKRKGGGKAA